MIEDKKGILVRLKESLWGSPKVDTEVKTTSVAVLGQVEQYYGRYMIPSFKQQTDVFWNDPIITEGVIMFAEQVMSTGFFLTGNPEYTLTLSGKTALDVIKEWCDKNNLDIKLMDIAIELRAFGNSIWRIDKEGFVKIPIESIWRAVRVSEDIPLQIRYNIQLTPLYGNVIVPWTEFLHFRVGVTGTLSPFGRGIMWGILARPSDSEGRTCPSLYDIRLAMRFSLTEGFRKFSFGNELWVFEGLSNEDFNASGIGEKIASMASTGNRIATNAKGRIELAIPERTQSYDQFIKQMNDEFMMALADPSLKLGLEKGFTKATSETASETYKVKINSMRRTIKQHMEDLFKQILDKLGYDAVQARIQLNFGAEEPKPTPVKEILLAVDRGILTRNEAREILSGYNKWNITGNIEGGDKPIEPSSKMGLGTDIRYTGKESIDEIKDTVKKLSEKLIEIETKRETEDKLRNEILKKKLEVVDKIIKGESE